MRNLALKVCLLISIFFANHVSATSIQIVVRDGAGEGFRSNQAVAPVRGNPGTTLGQQYQNVFNAAAAVWEHRVDSSVPILIDAALDPLSCSTNSGVLGSAGPLNGFVDFPNAPVSNTIYVVAQANSHAGIDLDESSSDIVATFNSRLGTPGCLTSLNWWLGINSPAPSGTISLYDTVLHEIGHGLGFLSLVDSQGQRLANLNDAFMLNLTDVSRGPWASLSNNGRRASSVNNGGLVWSGRNVAVGAGVFTQGRTGGRLRMFAPSTFQSGSSVSHWDTVLSPDELMEPIATNSSDACATVLAFKDMGWATMNECEPLFVIASGFIAPIINLLLGD